MLAVSSTVRDDKGSDGIGRNGMQRFRKPMLYVTHGEASNVARGAGVPRGRAQPLGATVRALRCLSALRHPLNSV
jgi:hypothetical protein